MLCMWGDMAFEAGQIVSFSENSGVSLAEHALIGRKPKLQHTGDSLRSFDLTLSLNGQRKGFVDPAEPALLLERLNAAVAAHQPLPFSWGNGVYEGLFLGESITLDREVSDGRGLLVSAVYTLTLKEFADNNPAKTAAPAVSSEAKTKLPANAQKQDNAPAKVSGSPAAQPKAATAAQVVRQE